MADQWTLQVKEEVMLGITAYPSLQDGETFGKSQLNFESGPYSVWSSKANKIINTDIQLDPKDDDSQVTPPKIVIDVKSIPYQNFQSKSK